MLHFVIIQRTISTPHDYKICTLEFELFTNASKLKDKIKKINDFFKHSIERKVL